MNLNMTDTTPVRQRRGRALRATLKDVALEAGVSIGTVSDIVNRGRSENYATNTQRKVLAAIEKLGYRPDKAAQGLKRGRSDTVGVILTRGFDNPYYARLFDTIRLSLEQYTLSAELMVVDRARIGGNIGRLYDWMISQGVDGLIVGPLYYWDHDIIRELRGFKRHRIPVVTFGAVEGEVGISNIQLGDVEAGKLAADYLLDKGHRRIAFLGAYDVGEAELARGTVQRGFEQVLERHGLVLSTWFIAAGDDGSFQHAFDESKAFAKRWLETDKAQRPTALMCKTDQIAITAAAALYQFGIKIPDELSVLGYDNLAESGYTVPALTTIDNAVERRMADAVRQIAKLLEAGPQNVDIPTSTVQPRVVERQTVISVKH